VRPACHAGAALVAARPGGAAHALSRDEQHGHAGRVTPVTLGRRAARRLHRIPRVAHQLRLAAPELRARPGVREPARRLRLTAGRQRLPARLAARRRAPRTRPRRRRRQPGLARSGRAQPPPRAGIGGGHRHRLRRRSAGHGARGVAMNASVALTAPEPAPDRHGPCLDARLPTGTLAGAWARRKGELALVTRARRRSQTVLVVGSGLAGAAAAASLSELGHRVVCLCFQDSPRRAHSVAAQGGINACKNYQNDGDSVQRLFLDTLKGGDFRSREANVYRLAELSVAIIDQCVAQGVPFAREYDGHLSNRSFGGALVSRTFYARGLTGQQLLLGAYQALAKEVA